MTIIVTNSDGNNTSHDGKVKVFTDEEGNLVVEKAEDKSFIAMYRAGYWNAVEYMDDQINEDANQAGFENIMQAFGDMFGNDHNIHVKLFDIVSDEYVLWIRRNR